MMRVGYRTRREFGEDRGGKRRRKVYNSNVFGGKKIRAKNQGLRAVAGVRPSVVL